LRIFGRFDHRVTERTAGRPGESGRRGFIGWFDHRVTERPSEALVDDASSAGSITV
jgi:hypothetical protein